MKFSDLFDFDRGFSSKADLLRASQESILTKKAKFLLIFDTSKQRTWIIATSNHLHCIVDIPERGPPKKKWSENRRTIYAGGKLLTTIIVDNEHNTVKINEHKPRKYSPRLFQDRSIKDAIRNLIETVF